MSRGDQTTADAFASSWNNLPEGSVYTEEQVRDWFAPLDPEDFRGARVLEMGCGNASLMVHVIRWSPAQLDGIDLGASVESAKKNLAAAAPSGWSVRQADLTTFSSAGYDIVYSIGVLHHLEAPKAGFDAVIRNTRPGGRFHCWVYAREGNAVVIALVEPLRRVASRLPWRLTKYGLATPLALPYFLYAKALAALPRWRALRSLPLYDYSLWIARREFAFFRHVAFDQLVTPRTVYLDRGTIEGWLAEDVNIAPGSTYVKMRNANSWKFGASIRSARP
jgi:SAM-dependent methyltransferase